MQPGRLMQADVLIVGAGPAGLFAAFQCGMAGLSAVVVDSLAQAGGQCAALYPEKPIYDIPACASIGAGELIARLEAQARPFEPRYLFGEQVVTLEGSAGDFVAGTLSGGAIRCGAVLIAAGVGVFRPNKPPLDGIEALEGRGVHFFVEQRAEFEGKRLVIVGGGDSALDWAVSLSQACRSLHLVHRRPKFTAAPSTVEALRRLVEAGRVQLLIPGQVTGIESRDGRLTHVCIGSGQDMQRLQADAVLFFLGLASTLGPIRDWGIDLEQGRIRVDPTTLATSRAGVFAIGDVATYANKLRLILCGFSEAAMAAHAIRRLLRPDEHYVHRHSTQQGIPAIAGQP